jgi:hypothetical protein
MANKINKEINTMTSKRNIEQREAQQGERMIELRIRFWTNDLAEGAGIIRPKHAWSSGMVRVERNKSHNIVPGKTLPFHSLMDLPTVVEKVLIAQGITLHASPKMEKYLVMEE